VIVLQLSGFSSRRTMQQQALIGLYIPLVLQVVMIYGADKRTRTSIAVKLRYLSKIVSYQLEYILI
jgi:hypothetical protein